VVDTVVVFSGGQHPGRSVLAALPAGAPVIAADRGAEHAVSLGVTLARAVGDFDSISPEALAALERSGVPLERHPPEKDASDLELALDAALELEPRRLLVVGGATGRLDHRLAELLLLGSPRYEGVELDAVLGGAQIHVVRDERVLAGRVRELISLLALHGAVEGVVSEGLVYPLAGERLEAGSSRGLSNLFASPTARLTLGRGVLLAVRPGQRASAGVFRSAQRSVQGGSASS
jgi:thiamine pyrophosphokinase